MSLLIFWSDITVFNSSSVKVLDKRKSGVTETYDSLLVNFLPKITVYLSGISDLDSGTVLPFG